jgi:hypothetical protein
MSNRERTVLAIALGSILLMLLVQAIVYRPSEPYLNNDENRHVMTGVFFRDFLTDLPITHPRDYVIRYYLQYPALGFPLWPPLFHFIEGLFMVLLGTSILVSKSVILAFAALACFYLFLLVRRTHGIEVAALAVPLLAFAPVFFILSHYVMLEVPTLALGLGATYHFVSFLDQERRSDLFAAALLSALAALTRFSAVYLLPVFLLLLIVRKKWGILRQRDTYLAATLGLLLVTPFYAITVAEVGWVYGKLLGGASVGQTGPPLSLSGLAFYPSQIPRQIGWFAVIPCVIGLARAFAPGERYRAFPYLAFVIVTFLLFTPMGIRDSRYAIYWVPSLALFAADGIRYLSGRIRVPWIYPALGAVAVLGTAAASVAEPVTYLRGYEAAARYVTGHTRTSKCCLFDGGLNGNFIYQMRRQDPARKLWVLRGDKILYSVLLYGQVGTAATPKDDEEMIATIFKYDPEFIIVEEPETFERIASAERFRAILQSHPERFGREVTIPVETNDPEFKNVKLLIYRSLIRNPKPAKQLEIDMLALRRTLRTSLAPGGPSK